MIRIGSAAVALFLTLTAVAAQTPPAPEPSPTATGGLEVTVTDDSEWQDLGIAIPAFPTNTDVTTQASTGSTAATGRALAQVITADLKNNGLFKPVGPDAVPMPSFAQVTAPDFAGWKARSTEMLVHGYVRGNADGSLVVGCYLYDVALGQQLAKGGWVVGRSLVARELEADEPVVRHIFVQGGDDPGPHRFP